MVCYDNNDYSLFIVPVAWVLPQSTISLIKLRLTLFSKYNPTLNFAELALLVSHVSLWGQETDLTQPQPSPLPSVFHHPSLPIFLYHFVSSRHVVLVSKLPPSLCILPQSPPSPRPLSTFHSLLSYDISTFSSRWKVREGMAILMTCSKGCDRGTEAQTRAESKCPDLSTLAGLRT